jgi:hypothetical protein
MGRLRSLVNKLRRDASGELDSFNLTSGKTYYYDHLEASKQMFLHAVYLQEGTQENPPPEIYHKICEATDPGEVLDRFKPENPQRAFVDLSQLYDREILVNERRLVPSEDAPGESDATT